ncbi:MAG: outer membrane protein transport protein [Myxococcales bacterium]|nr:outer membrane protein transport protein [Myxococcales bacterium]
MKHKLLMACLVTGVLTPALASANPEPTAYDSRSIAMGLTGVTYLDRASALVLNPANLEGINKLGFTFNFTALFVNQRAPVQGPNTRLDSGVGFGPLPSGFIAGRIAPRVVFAGGIYIETGYGSSFSQVTCLDGDPVGPGPDYTPNNDTNAGPGQCTVPTPQNLDVTFFVGEFSTGFSFLAHEKFILGLALRLPFSKQVADIYQNIGAATPILPSPTYGRVKNDLGGVGVPSLRIGFTIKPHRKVRISAMYRMASKIKLTGTTETALIAGADPITLEAEADWFIPHAIAFGVSYQANSHLLLAFEGRVQFHGAKNSGNQNQTVTATDPDGVFPDTRIVVPFGWENAWSAKIGFEYRFTQDLLALRLGVNVAKGATSAKWAQYFTPPPAPAGVQTVTAGLGFYWDDRNDPSIKDKYRLDLGGLFAFTKDTIGNEFIGQRALVPGGDPDNPIDNPRICSEDQVVRTGCPGEYRVFSYWASVSFTLQY